MALFKQIFAEDASAPGRVASNGVVSIFAPGTRTLINIFTTTGDPLANPVRVNEYGFGTAFSAPGYTQVAWEAVAPGLTFSGTFESYEGVLAQAVAAEGRAAAAVQAVPEKVVAEVAAAVASGDFRGPPGKDGEPSFPTSQIIKYTASGDVESVTASGITTSYTYNPDGSVATDSRPGITRGYTYDAFGNLVSIERLAPGPSVTESFAAADGPLLGTKTTTGDLTWTADGTTVLGRSAGLLKAISGTGIGFALLNPAAVVRMEAYCEFLNPTRASRRSALVFRFQDTNNYWAVTPRANNTIQTWALMKVVAGVTTVLASIPGEAVIGTHRVEATATSVKWFIDGTIFTTVDDAALSTAKRVGFRGEFNTDPSTRWDNFKVWGEL